ncbi:MAG: CinA family protein [Bacilli bacterium]|nr:CinA family protein [Bacilli bacterium]
MEEVVERLRKLNKTISTMESCTGGAVVNAITNIEGASDVIKFSAVTYSNEFKVKMGVSEEIINKYTVYSMKVAEEMSKNISLYTNSDYGIGITGKLNRIDKNNLYGDDCVVYVSIYIKESDEFDNFILKVTESNRVDNKNLIIKRLEEKLLLLM